MWSLQCRQKQHTGKKTNQQTNKRCSVERKCKGRGSDKYNATLLLRCWRREIDSDGLFQLLCLLLCCKTFHCSETITLCKVADPRDCHLEKKCILTVEWGLMLWVWHEGKSHNPHTLFQLGSHMKALRPGDPSSKGEGNTQPPHSSQIDCPFIFTLV